MLKEAILVQCSKWVKHHWCTLWFVLRFWEGGKRVRVAMDEREMLGFWPGGR
jgi:hypothetical protein